MQEQIAAVGPWNQRTGEDDLNRDYFKEFVDIVLLAWAEDTFSFPGKFWTIPSPDFVNPHVHEVYPNYGRGVGTNMRIHEIGIAPKCYQRPHPQLYGGFTHSLRTALFWAKYAGRPIVLSGNFEFCRNLWRAYGDEAGWGGLLVLADSDAAAREHAQDMLWFWDSWSKPFGQDYPYLLIGDPDTVSRRIEAATREIPINECFLLIPQGIHDRDRILRSLELFATRVMPRFS